MEEWQKPEIITLWIVIIVVFLILLLAFITLLIRSIFIKKIKTKIAESNAKLQHQQVLLETTIKTQEKERKRIAADLHDALIGKLMVLQMSKQVNADEKDTIHLVDECITVARSISHDLSPPLLEYTTLQDLISDLLHPWKEKIIINIKNDIRSDYDYTNEFKIQLIRIIQELITNILKHAEATEIQCVYRQTKKRLILQIKDNGKGYDTKKSEKGLGLNNIETRVQYLKGCYHLKSKVNKGTTALFLFKLKN